MGRCDFIEFDVQLTGDYVPVVIHDPTLTRTSNILASSIYQQKKSTRLVDYTYDELKVLDMGTWFYEQDPFGTLGSEKKSSATDAQLPQPLLTLDEMLHWAKQNQVLLNLEIKEPESSPHSEVIVEKVVDQLHNHQCLNQVLVSSFNHQYLVECKKRASTLLTSALAEEPPYENPKELVAYLKDIGASGYHPDTNYLELQIIPYLRSNRIMITVYTVNNEQRKRELFAAGVTSVVTDFL